MTTAANIAQQWKQKEFIQTECPTDTQREGPKEHTNSFGLSLKDAQVRNNRSKIMEETGEPN